MRILQLIIITGISSFVFGCASMKPVAFENDKIKLEPLQFFVGHTRSSGVLENRGGKPTARITTETEGVIKDGALTLNRTFIPKAERKITAHGNCGR